MKKKLAVIVVLTFLLSLTAFAQKVTTDWDRTEDFSKFHTYAWQKSPNPAPGFWDQRIMDAVDKELQGKGLTKVESNPDLWVVYSNSVKDSKQVVGNNYGMGPGWGWGWGWGWGGPGFSQTVYDTYITKQGTLVIELADVPNKQLLWRGSATDTLSDNSEKNIKILNSAVSKLFKNFPPKPPKEEKK